MAMLITKPTEYGVDASYWRIVTGTIDYDSHTLIVSLQGYLDEAARNAGKRHLGARQIIWQADEFPDVAEPTRSALYAKLMAMPDWADATEV